MTEYDSHPSWEEQDGDVIVPSGDDTETPPTSDEIDGHYEYLMQEQQAREWQIDQIRQHADFTKRNRLLLEAGDLAAHSRKSETFASQLAKQGSDSLPADRRAETDRAEAKRAVSEACGACALRRFCDLKADGVRQAIGLDTEINPDTAQQRDRLRRRAGKPENNHFCETNLNPARLKDDIG